MTSCKRSVLCNKWGFVFRMKLLDSIKMHTLAT